MKLRYRIYHPLDCVGYVDVHMGVIEVADDASVSDLLQGVAATHASPVPTDVHICDGEFDLGVPDPTLRALAAGDLINLHVPGHWRGLHRVEPDGAFAQIDPDDVMLCAATARRECVATS